MGDERLREAAIRLFRRYVDTFVEPYGICPWAAPARRDGRVRETVICDREATLEATLQAIELFSRDRDLEIGIVLFPRVSLDRPAFARFVAEVRVADARARDNDVPFAMAEFHPEAPAAISPSGAFVSFLRRTPDPTIQLVRRSALDRVRGEEDQGSGYLDPAMLDQLLAMPLAPPKPQLHDRVERHNRDTICKAGIDAISSLLDDLVREREALYAALEAQDAQATR